MTTVDELRERLIVPPGAVNGEGVQPGAALNLLQLREGNFEARNLQANFDALVRAIAPSPPSLLNVARLLGLGYFVGEVSSTVDSVFSHSLGRKPLLIVLSVVVTAGTNSVADLGSAKVVGLPEGGAPNIAQWTSTYIAVRATVTGRYVFLVI